MEYANQELGNNNRAAYELRESIAKACWKLEPMLADVDPSKLIGRV